MKISNVEDLRVALALGEGPTLEFKSNVPQPQLLAKVLSAFQNSHGGNILLGIAEPGEIVGINAQAALNIYNRAKKLIEPYDISTFQVIEVDGKSVAVISIDGNSTRVVGLTVNGISYQRLGSRIVPITAQSFVEKLIPNFPRRAKSAHTFQTSRLRLKN